MAMTKVQMQAALAAKLGVSKKQVGQFFEELANPATGAQIQVPAKQVVRFRVAKAAKDAILGQT